MRRQSIYNSLNSNIVCEHIPKKLKGKKEKVFFTNLSII